MGPRFRGDDSTARSLIYLQRDEPVAAGITYPSTLPMERIAASMRLLSASQKFANSG
jgi:hypothetical protein